MDIVSAGPAGGADAALNGSFRRCRFRDRNRPDEPSHARSAPAVPRPVRESGAVQIAAPSQEKLQYRLRTDPRGYPSPSEKNAPRELSSAGRETKARRWAPVYL